ncbi:hypothetical protein ACFLYB_00260 [Chloroflexota bacterium]
MEEARSSWNTIYQNREGFECQITLRDEDETNLTHRASQVMTSITKLGGLAVKRKGFETNNNGNHQKEQAVDQTAPDKREKTYIDENGTRRCNKWLKNGTVCGQPVVEKDGRYGPFWSCPNFKEHAA